MNKALKEMVYSSQSTIHGTGLFAKKDIGVGALIGTYQGPTAKRNGTYVLWVYDGDDDHPVGRSGRNLLRYLNHADDSNAEFDGFDLYAIKAIHIDDEITFDYNGAEQ